LIHTKIAPTGIDKRIQRAEQYLHDNLLSDYSCDISAYGRAYADSINGVIKPRAYVGNGEYKPLLTDDRINGLHFFFVENEESDVEVGTCIRSNDVDLIVIIDDISKVRGDIAHYADEEIVQNVLHYAKSFMRISKITKGEKALDGFDVENLKFIYPFFVFKLTGKINNY